MILHQGPLFSAAYCRHTLRREWREGILQGICQNDFFSGTCMGPQLVHKVEWLSKISHFVAHYQGFPPTRLFCASGILLLDMNLREGEL